MKKLAIIAILACTAAAASATDIGLRLGRGPQTDTTTAGLTLNHKFDNFGLEATYDRTSSPAILDRYTVTASRDIAKFGDLSVNAKAGAAYMIAPGLPSGFAGLVGAGVSYPITTALNVTADWQHQFGQDAVKAADGNTVKIGVAYQLNKSVALTADYSRQFIQETNSATVGVKYSF